MDFRHLSKPHVVQSFSGYLRVLRDFGLLDVFISNIKYIIKKVVCSKDPLPII